MVWFWQTRQRSSLVMSSMRASSAGSAAVRCAVGASNFTVASAEAAEAAGTEADAAAGGTSSAKAGAASAKASSAARRNRPASAIELPQQRQHGVVKHLR